MLSNSILFVVFVAATAFCEPHYNIPDPECSGPFGVCTQEDKDRLGYAAIKKLHAKMDEDSDGQVEIQETKEVCLYFRLFFVFLFKNRN